MEQISILLAEDQTVIRMALVHYFNSFSHFSVIAEASNGVEMIEKYNTYTPDVVLCDIKMPLLDGLDAATKILKDYREAKIIIMSGYYAQSTISELVNIGIKGFVDKCASLNELKSVLELIACGGSFYKAKDGLIEMNPVRERKKVANHKHYKLTHREIDILEQIGLGKTSQEIANILYISKRTVDFHRTQMMQKLNLKSSCQLIIYATDFLKSRG